MLLKTLLLLSLAMSKPVMAQPTDATNPVDAPAPPAKVTFPVPGPDHSVIEEGFSQEIRTAEAHLAEAVAANEKAYLAFLDFLKERSQRLEDIGKSAKSLKTEESAHETGHRLQAINALWRQLVDELRTTFSTLQSLSFKELPALIEPANSPSSVEGPPAAAAYRRSHRQAAGKILAINRSVGFHIEELKKDSFVLLNDVGGTRANLLKHCDANPDDCRSQTGFKQEDVDDFVRELQVIPFKMKAGYAAKWFEIKRKSKMGLDGWVDLLYQALILLILIISPWLMSRVFDWVTDRVREIRAEIVADNVVAYREESAVAGWITHALPFLTPTCMLALTFWAKHLVRLTDFPELASLIFYLQIYYCYRLTRILFRLVLNAVLRYDLPAQAGKGKISSFARRISRLIFIEIGVLHLIGDTARQALVYQLVSSLTLLLNVFILFFESRRWKEEITRSFSLRFPETWRKLSPAEGKGYFLLACPLLLLAAVIHELSNIIYSHLLRFDFTKRILSEILRKKLQAAPDEKTNGNKPSEEYLGYFDYYLAADDEIFVERKDSLVGEIIDLASKWSAGDSRDGLALIVGNRGMGKTTALRRIHSGLEKTCDAFLGHVPPKILGEEDFYAWLGRACGHKIDGPEDFLAWDRQLRAKKALIIDDIHNLFLSRIGGFSAYDAFCGVIGLETKNVFWCLSANSRAWAYLNGVYGNEHFHGRVLALKPWKDFEIQELILNRHRQSGHERTFDRSILAIGNRDGSTQQAEGQFFRLLWGQSRGNPRTAMMYWISAISEDAPRSVHVGVPAFVDSTLVEKMSDEGHFLLASVARHDSLSVQELISVTGIQPATVRKCLKEFADKNLTWTDEGGRVRISSKSQYVIDYFLIGKNFLYE